MAPALLDTETAEKPPLRTDEHGVVRVGGTKVTLESIVYAFDEGCSADEIAQDFPAVSMADVHAAIAYRLRHRGDVDAYLEWRRQADADARRHWETIFPQAELHARILARRAAQQRKAA